MSVDELVGSAGVLLLLSAFAMNARGRIAHTSTAYALMNASGAGLACYASYLIAYRPFVVLEGTWCLVALLALRGGDEHTRTSAPSSNAEGGT